VPDARITVQKAGTYEFMRFKTEADGTQFLHGLAPAEYAIGIHQEEAIPFRTAVLVPPGETVLVNVDLKTGGRVTGTVTDR